MPRLVLRADGGPGVGTGHLARCLALAEAWRDGGGEALLVSTGCPPEWKARFLDEGVDLEPAVDAWPDGDWTVVDGYAIGLPERRPERVAVIDDHGRSSVVRPDLVIDPNVGATQRHYPERIAGDGLLVGPRYSLIRRDLRSAARATVGRAVPQRAERLLVALGGEPTRRHLHNVDVALRDPGLAELTVDQLAGRRDPTGAMAAADVALAGAGVTASELCAFGIPAVLLALADNQEPVVDAIEAARAAVSASPTDPTGMALAVSALVGDADRRRAMADAGRALVDGRGALRVAARLRADLLRLRPAGTDDARLLFEWVNDSVVRSTALAPAPVAWDTHTTWLEARLADPTCRLWIVEDEQGRSIGQVRVDGDAGEVEMSVGLAAASRGSRLGPAAVDAAVRRVFADTSATTVVARIRDANIASVLAFGDAGFLPAGEGTDGAVTWLRYARAR